MRLLTISALLGVAAGLSTSVGSSFSRSFGFTPSHHGGFSSSHLGGFSSSHRGGFSSHSFGAPVMTSAHLGPSLSSSHVSASHHTPSFFSHVPGGAPSYGPKSVGGPIPSGTKAARDAIYDQNAFRAYGIELSPSDWAKLEANPAAEEYVRCTVTTGYGESHAQSFPNAGCRFKGSVGSLRICLDPSTRSFDKHTSVCRKLSIKVKADKFGGGLIHGMRHLVFNGAPVDDSLMAERSSYYLANQLGLVAPRAVNAMLYVNGQYDGVYSFVEEIDDKMMEDRFASDNNRGRGALYKEFWFNDFEPAKALAHNSHRSGPKESGFLKEIYRGLEAADISAGSARAFLEKFFDVQSIIDVTAYNTMVGNSDDWRQRHNFYMYLREDQNGKKFVMMPWDYDRLNDEGHETRGALKGRPWWEYIAPTDPECTAGVDTAAEKAIRYGYSSWEVPYWEDLFFQLPVDIDIPVSCDKFTRLMQVSIAQDIRDRTIQMSQTANLPNLKNQMDKWANQIAEAVDMDPDGPGASAMRAASQKLYSHFQSASQKAASQARSAGGSSYGGSSQFPSSISHSGFAPSLSSRSAHVGSFSHSSSFHSVPSFSAPAYSGMPHLAHTRGFSSGTLGMHTAPSFTSFGHGTRVFG